MTTESTLRAQPLAVVDVFAEREALLQALRSGEGLAERVRGMAAASFGCALLYGAVLGVQMGGWQVLSSPVKFPLILLGTAVLCVAALYVLLALAGARLRWLQVVGLALCSVTASGVSMAALLPVTAFWTFVFHGEREAVTLVHTGAFCLAGFLGTRFGLQTARELLPEPRAYRVMVVWMWLYGLVAQQMAWLFRPHFHPTEVFMRPLDSGGSALETIARLLLGRF
jgi:hypothetical protein